MNFTEIPVTFECQGDTLLGILTRPEFPADIGVVIPVGGPQYRAGSHRQFTLLARSLAAEGYAVLRFDYRGMGDSTGAQVQFENAVPDIGAAISALFTHTPELKRAALWGLCDAASSSLLYAEANETHQIAGLCILNPWVRSDVSLAKTHVKHYYLQRVFNIDFWIKLFTGKVAIVRAISEALSKIRQAFLSKGTTSRTSYQTYQSKMAIGAERFRGELLIILSGNDLTAKEFDDHTAHHPIWNTVQARQRCHTQRVPDADHTFSRKTWRDDVASITSDWLKTLR